MTINDELEQLKTDLHFEVGEVFAVYAQYQALPAFDQKLWDLICAADVNGLMKIYAGFPDEVAGYTAWSTGDVKTKLVRQGYRL